MFIGKIMKSALGYFPFRSRHRLVDEQETSSESYFDVGVLPSGNELRASSRAIHRQHVLSGILVSCLLILFFFNAARWFFQPAPKIWLTGPECTYAGPIEAIDVTE